MFEWLGFAAAEVLNLRTARFEEGYEGEREAMDSAVVVEVFWFVGLDFEGWKSGELKRKKWENEEGLRC